MTTLTLWLGLKSRTMKNTTDYSFVSTLRKNPFSKVSFLCQAPSFWSLLPTFHTSYSCFRKSVLFNLLCHRRCVSSSRELPWPLWCSWLLCAVFWEGHAPYQQQPVFWKCVSPRDAMGQVPRCSILPGSKTSSPTIVAPPSRASSVVAPAVSWWSSPCVWSRTVPGQRDLLQQQQHPNSSRPHNLWQPLQLPSPQSCLQERRPAWFQSLPPQPKRSASPDRNTILLIGKGTGFIRVRSASANMLYGRWLMKVN